MHAATRRAIFRRLQAANPSPTTELLHGSPFELLVAVMLSAHTTDKSVNAATRNLFPVACTPEAIVKLGIEGVKPYIQPVGLYNTKAKNLVGLAQQIVAQHGGQVPGSREALEALPGVGRKTASIILNMVFGQAEVAVDSIDRHLGLTEHHVENDARGLAADSRQRFQCFAAAGYLASMLRDDLLCESDEIARLRIVQTNRLDVGLHTFDPELHDRFRCA